MTRNEDSQIIKIAKMHYEMGMSQDQIAREEFISPSSVSRMLKRALERQYVVFQVGYPIDSVADLEEDFYKYFDVEQVFITPAYLENYQMRMIDTCKAAAKGINRLVHAGEIIAVAWGRTMEYLMDFLVPPQQIKQDVKVVLFNGSIASVLESAKSSKIVERFSENYMAEGYLIPAPIFVDSKELVEAMKSESQIKKVYNMALQSDLAIFGIGNASLNSILIERGALPAEEYRQIIELGAVGEIGGRYFDKNGQPIQHSIGERTMAIELSELKKKKNRIGIAVGKEKCMAALGALRGGIVNRIYMDEVTAKQVLTLHRKSLD